MALQQTIPANSIAVNKAFLTTEDAAQLFSHSYAMPKPMSVIQIDGYDSQNFLIEIKTDDCINGDTLCGSKDGKYVLKIMSGEESKDEPGCRVIHSFQKYLRQHGFINAPPLQNVHGDDLRLEIFSRVQSADAAHYPGQRIHGQFLVRAYPFIEGVTLSNTVPANSTQIFYELGKSLAKLHKILENFPHDIEPLKKKAENLEWSLDRLNLILKHIDVVKEDSRRNLVQDVVRAFETKVLTKKNDFRKGIIHADFSHTNIVIVPESDSCNNHMDGDKSNRTNYKLGGVLDFDDSQYNSYVYDVGISMMYLSLSKAAENQPLHASAAFLAGYQCVYPLTQVELEVLHVCQAARYTQSLVMGLYTYTLQPGNEYLLETQNGWPVLENLWGMDVEKLWKMWQDVANECAKFEKNHGI